METSQSRHALSKQLEPTQALFVYPTIPPCAFLLDSHISSCPIPTGPALRSYEPLSGFRDGFPVNEADLVTIRQFSAFPFVDLCQFYGL